MTTRRPWHVPPPWPTVTASQPKTRAEVASLAAAACERHSARIAAPFDRRSWRGRGAAA